MSGDDREVVTLPTVTELKAKRPPICRDRSILSDEIAPDLTLGDHPLLKAVRR